MSSHIEGWIEINTSREWLGKVKVDWEFLKGGRSGTLLSNLYELADKKILPDDLSNEVISDFDVTQYVGVPHSITYEKMLFAEWELIEEDWYFLYDLMRVTTDYHGENNTRLIFWSG